MSLVVSFAITAVFYLAAPCLVAALLSRSNKVMTTKHRVLTCVISALVVYMAFSAITFSATGHVGSATPALIWGLIGYAIMPKVYESTPSKY